MDANKAAHGIIDIQDRLIPHDLRLEQGILACILLEGGGDSLGQCISARLNARMFYAPKHQMIYEVMCALNFSGDNIDEIILRDELIKQGRYEEIGGDAYLFEIAGQVSTTAHMPHYIERIKDYHLLRELIRFSNRTIEGVFEHTLAPNELISEVQSSLMQLTEQHVTAETQTSREVARDAMILLSELKERGDGMMGISSGFPKLDQITLGWQPGQLIVLAARPSGGKTALMLDFLEAAMSQKERYRAMVFSLEMPNRSLALRYLFKRAGFSKNHYMRLVKDARGQMDAFDTKLQDCDQKIADAARRLEVMPIAWEQKPGQTMDEIIVKARREHAKDPLSIIFIDYLQLIAADKSARSIEEKTAAVSAGCNTLSLSLGIPVIVLAQLNRDCEKEKRAPRYSDLRGSGSVEQDADVIILLHRDPDAARNSDGYWVDAIVDKCRDGSVGTVRLWFKTQLAEFTEYNEQEDEEQ